MIDQDKLNRLDILTKRSFKLKAKFSDNTISKVKLKKAISLWIRVLRLIKSEAKTLNS